ncbi:MAG: tetratricopeptide repeat protein, partial [Myxococcota bacterium]
MFNLGGVEPALALAKEIVAEAKNIDALALRAEAQLLYGRLLHSSGKTPEAQVQLRDGVASAIAADYDVLAFESWNALADAQGGAEPTEAGRYAEAYWIRLDRDPFLGAKLFTQRGMTALGAARHEDARKTLGEALRYLESSAYDDYPLEVRILGGLAAANAKVGKLTNAVEFNKRGQTLSASLFGEVNPQTLSLQLNRGNLLYLSGDYEGALETHQGLLHTYEALYGPEHKDTARTVFNIAVVNLALGNNDDALKMLERAVEIRTATLGPKHASTLRGEQAVVHTLKELARYDEAARRAEAVIQNQRETLGDDHYDIAYSLVTLAEVLGLQGKIDAGVQVGTDALAMIERVMGTGHPFYGEALTTVGEILARGARREEAISRFEGAIKTLKNYDGDATLIAKARFGPASLRGVGPRCLRPATA